LEGEAVPWGKFFSGFMMFPVLFRHPVFKGIWFILEMVGKTINLKLNENTL
jgi:hypothetical protein